MSKEQITNLIQLLPFIGLMAGGETKSGGTAAFITRLFEAAIISGVVMYGTQMVMKTDIQYIKDQIKDVRIEVQEIRRDFYKPRWGDR